MNSQTSQNQFDAIIVNEPSPAPEHRAASPGSPSAFDVASLKRKLRAGSFYRKLSDDQGCTLLQWFNETDDLSEIQRRVAAPPPAGFGLNVDYTSLKRLRSAQRSAQFTQDNQDILDTIHDMEASADFSQSARIQKAIHQVLLQRAFEIAASRPDCPSLPRLLASLEKLSALELKREKLLLTHRKSAPSTASTSRHRVELTIAPGNHTLQKIAIPPTDPTAPQLPASTDGPQNQIQSPPPNNSVPHSHE